MKYLGHFGVKKVYFLDCLPSRSGYGLLLDSKEEIVKV